MALIESLTPYERFIQSTDNPATRRHYDYGMKAFLTFAKITADELVKASAMVIEDTVKLHIKHMEDKGLSWGTRAAVVNALWKFCKVNKLKDVDFDEIRKRLGNDETDRTDEPYNRDILRRLMDAADLRKKVIVGIFATSGIRRSALPPLKLKHIQKVLIPETNSETYVLTIYANSKKDRYQTFVTPEIAVLIDTYLQVRRSAGEETGPDSPLVREQYDPTANHAAAEDDVKLARHVSQSTIAQLVSMLLVQAGLKDEIRKRGIHEVHGFRKHVYTELIKAGVKEVNVKRIIGHSTGLGKNYDRQTVEDMLRDYAKAIPALTISNETKLARQVEELKTQTADVDLMKKMHLDMKLALEEEREARKRLEAKVALLESGKV